MNLRDEIEEVIGAYIAYHTLKYVADKVLEIPQLVALQEKAQLWDKMILAEKNADDVNHRG